MKGLICYYSSTGNTKLACEYIAKRIKNVEFDFFDIVKEGIPDIKKYDLLGFAAWADYLSAPKKIFDFLKQIKGSGKPAFVFNTFGNYSGRTLRDIKNSVEKSDFNVIASYALHTPENVPILIAMGMDRADAPSPKELSDFNNFISDFDSLLGDYLKNKQFNRKLLKGLGSRLIPKLPRKTSQVTSAIFAGNFKTDTSLCTKCGLCKTICPYEAISLNPYPKYNTQKCFGCWACYNRCPTKAIYTKKYKNKGHYIEPNQLIKEKLK